MTTHLLEQNIAKHISLPEREVREFCGLFHHHHIKKKDFLLREGEVCKFEAFVTKGMFRVYHIDSNGFEQVLYFAIEDWWVTDIDSFINQRQSSLYIEAIEDSSIYQLSKNNMDKLLFDIPKFERFFRIILQNAYTREQLRVIENLSLSAEERYESFLKKYPHIAQVVTQKQIASYLGITPEFLSAIRKEKTKRIS